MIKVILESPYSGNVKRNVEYARECLKDSLKRGEAPIAGQLIIGGKSGIEAGLAWLSVADLHVFYMDHGISPGMQHAYDNSPIDVEFRFLYND